MALTRIQPPAVADVREPNFRNIVINGDMAVAQRGTTATGIGNGDNACHTVDRFSFYEEGATSGEFTMSQDTDVPTGQGFAKSVKLDCTTADGTLAAAEVAALEYKMEGQDLQYIKKGTSNAESLTLTFWVKTNKTGTYVVTWYDNDNDRQTSQNYTVSVADTWEKKNITFAPDTSGTLTNDNTLALAMYFILGAGTDYTSGSAATAWEVFTGNADNWCGGQTVNMLDSTSNYINITGVQLEAGSVATDFEVVPYDQSFFRCQRYCVIGGREQVYNEIGNLGIAFSTTQADNNIYLYQPMRTIPSLTQSGSFQLSDASSASATTSITLMTTQSSSNNISLRSVVSSGLTDKRPYRLEAANSAAAYILLSAEL